MRTLTFIFVILLAGCNASTEEVSMACRWVLYEDQIESFVFNLSKKEVYWVNEDKRIKLSEVNEGRIVFDGTRSKLLVGDKQYKNDVPIGFVIDRVTGRLSITGISVPSGYNNECVTTTKVI